VVLELMSKVVPAPATAWTFFLRLTLLLCALAGTIRLAWWLFTWPDIGLWSYAVFGILFAMSPLLVTVLAYDAITTFLPRPWASIRQWDQQQRQKLDRSATAVCLSTLPLTTLLFVVHRLAQKEAARDYVGGLIDWIFWFALLSLAMAALAGLIGFALAAYLRRFPV
jgi:hypothetical protein